MTQLYLISPPKFELVDFRKQLEAALTAASYPAVLNPHPVYGGGKEPFIGAFQLRLKDADNAYIIRATKELLPICRDFNVAFIINDRVDLCVELQLDGVHLGQEDLLHLALSGRGYPSLTHPACEPSSSTPPACGGGKGRDTTAPRDGVEPPLNPPRKREGNPIAEIRARLSDEMALGITCHASTHLAMEAAEAGADYVAFGAFYPTTSKPKEKLEKWGTPTIDMIKWWSTYTEIPCVAIGGITPYNALPLIEAGADFIAVIQAVWFHPAGPGDAVKQFNALMG